MRTNTATAAQISRALRKGGLNPLASGSRTTRQGIRVKSNGRNLGFLPINVVIDAEEPRIRERLAAKATEILTGLGFDVQRADGSNFLQVASWAN